MTNFDLKMSQKEGDIPQPGQILSMNGYRVEDTMPPRRGGGVVGTTTLCRVHSVCAVYIHCTCTVTLYSTRCAVHVHCTVYCIVYTMHAHVQCAVHVRCTLHIHAIRNGHLGLVWSPFGLQINPES